MEGMICSYSLSMRRPTFNVSQDFPILERRLSPWYVTTFYIAYGTVIAYLPCPMLQCIISTLVLADIKFTQ